MNKHRYRLIFSKTLGFLIPVAENTNANRKPGQTRGPSLAPFAGSLKALPLAILSCFIQPSFAEILAEPGQRMGMNQSSSGVPVMEIADPNAKGLSHNRFQEFNVDKPGLIFNNSLRDGTSQIGGFVVHNPNLTREARAILTEVSGPHASSLAGILEVFGGTADILIANTKIAFGLEHVTQLIGGSLYSDLTLSKGLSILDSEQAAYGKNGNKKHFKKVEFNTAWSHPFALASQDFSFSSRIGGQYSVDNLLNAEKLGLGDEFTVRGFKGPPLWGDQAIYLSNTVTMPLQLLGGTISPLIGLDTGYAHDVAPHKDHGSITGLALGTSANWRYGGGSITLGVPLSMSDALKDNSEGTVIYLSTYLTL